MSWWDGVSVRGARPDGTVAHIRFRIGPLQSLQLGLAMAVPCMVVFIAGHLRYGDPYPHDFWATPVVVVVAMSLMQAGYRAELTDQALVLRGGTGPVPMSGFPYDPSFNRKVGTIETWWATRRGW